MNPGDEGGWLPSIALLLFRRSRKQQPNKSAAIASNASGTPTPIPIFSRLVNPESLDSGATGSAVAVEVADELSELEADDIDVERLLADETAVNIKVEEPEKDAKLDVSVDELLDAVGVDAETCSDPDDIEDCNTLVSVDDPVTDAVTPVGNVPLAGGAAVAGPNSCMK